jgi:hypothetical protein
MKYVSLKKWSGQFESPRVLARIRRTILGTMAGGECVCVLDDGVAGLTDAAREEIQRGWPPTKVKFSTTHPSATNPPKKKERRPRRPRL